MGELRKVTEALGYAYKNWKGAEKQKNVSKELFFHAATEELAKETPAKIVQGFWADTPEDAEDQAKRTFPTFKVVAIQPGIEGQFDAVLEEDPELRPFAYVNLDDGMVYSRQISEGSPVLDDEQLRNDDPDLWAEITEEVRQLKPLDVLTNEQLARLQQYVYAGKPTVKLGAPRKAKPEELETSE